MALLDQYLTGRNTEIALARSAAPESISRDGEVSNDRNGAEQSNRLEHEPISAQAESSK
jgi:hypothetical protein